MNRSHTELAFEVLRIYLGVAFLVKGIHFISDGRLIPTLLADGQMTFSAVAVGHYVALAHVGGATPTTRRRAPACTPAAPASAATPPATTTTPLASATPAR